MDARESLLRDFVEEATFLAAGLERGHGILLRMEEEGSPVTKDQQTRLIVVACLQYQREMARLLGGMCALTAQEASDSGEELTCQTLAGERGT